MKKAINKKYIEVDKTESKIIEILSLEERGLSATHISKEIQLARTSVYNALEKLITKKIVICNKFLYCISDKDFTKHKKVESDPLALIDGCLDEILSLKSGEIVYSIESDTEIDWLIKNQNKFENWQKDIAKKGIVLKGIGSKKALDKFKLNLSSVTKQVVSKRSGSARFVDEPIFGSCTVISFKNSVFFISRVEKYFLRIDNKHIAFFIQNLVDILSSHFRHSSIV